MSPAAVHPAAFFVLNLPFGLTTGYIIAVLPLQLTSAGVSVGSTAAVIAFALSPKIWKFIWAPIADLTLTLRAWYAIGATMAAAMLIAAGLIPVSKGLVWPIATAVFLAEVGVSFLTIALAGLMAQAAPDRQKGRASGWYQLGGKVAKGLAAGAGVWLVAHTGSALTAAAGLAAICAMCMFALGFVSVPPPCAGPSVKGRLAQYALDLLDLRRNPTSRFVLFIAILPIGMVGVGNFWPGVGSEWRASPNTIALMVGPIEALAAVFGCLIAGWLADRLDRRAVFLGSCLALALVELILSVGPRIPSSFVAGVFSVSLLLAMTDAAFTAVVLTVIGVRRAATKYAIVFGVGNIPDICTTSLSGFVHDAWGLSAMLQVEASLSLLCIPIAALYAATQSKRGLAAQFAIAS